MPLIGSLLSLPFIAVFFLAWIAASLLPPLSVASLMCLLLHPLATLRKILLFITTIQYLLFCNDKKWKEPSEDPASFFEGQTIKEGSIDKKTIIFVRHGESTWNDTFNKGDRSTISFVINFIPNLVWSAFFEWYLFVSGAEDESWFYDSPLSLKGIRQAQGLQKFLRETKLEYSTPQEAELLRLMVLEDSKDTKEAPSQMVSSSLRRSISTMAISFQDRLEQKIPGDKVLILPQLQEISRNPDALSITPPKGTIKPSWTDGPYVESVLSQMDTSMHTGNKPIDSNGLKRMEEFCRVAFGDIKKDSIICGGHSLWFRSFFRTYLPRNVEHISKKKKLINGGCVGFTLQRISTPNGDRYLIDHKTITVLYGGF